MARWRAISRNEVGRVALAGQQMASVNLRIPECATGLASFVSPVLVAGFLLFGGASRHGLRKELAAHRLSLITSTEIFRLETKCLWRKATMSS